MTEPPYDPEADRPILRSVAVPGRIRSQNNGKKHPS
jgi:hypothetical protein